MFVKIASEWPDSDMRWRGFKRDACKRDACKRDKVAFIFFTLMT